MIRQIQRTQQTQGTQRTHLKTVAAIPCFNTEPFIGDVVSGARKHVDQVIVIDDGSHDGTAEAARIAGATVMNHTSNKGYGGAIKSCFEAAKANAADVLVILDGDGQHRPDEIPRVLGPIVRGEADLVVGSRFPSLTQQTQETPQAPMPRYRALGIKVITGLWNFGSSGKVSDTQSGFRAYGNGLLESIRLSDNGMGVSIETLEKARRRRAVVKEVPISCTYVPSSLNRRAIRHGLGVAFSVVKIRLKNSLVRNGNA